MAVNGVADQWYKRGPNGKSVPSADHGKGKRWQARWRDPGGRQRSRSFDRKKDAENYLATRTADTARGTWIDPDAGRITFREYAEMWMGAQTHKTTTSETVRARVKHAIRKFGDRPIGSIQLLEVQAWLKELSEQLSASYINQILFTTSSIFKTAVLEKRIPATPFVNGVVKPLPTPRREMDPMQMADIAAISEAMPHRYSALILIAVATGLRKGEILGLEENAIDLEAGTLTVTQQLVNPVGAPRSIGPLKTTAARRTIPLCETAVAILSAHLAAYPPRSAIVTELDERGNVAGARQARLVFVNEADKPIAESSLDKEWKRAVATLDTEPMVAPGEVATFHDLRHYFASALIDGGASVAHVQGVMGHATPAETLRTYTHWFPNREGLTRAAIETALRGVHQMCTVRTAA